MVVMSPLFTGKLVLLDMRNLEDLHYMVPMQINTKKSYRRYCFIKYLELLGEGKLLSFPMVIKNTETPDFIISIKGKTIGIEQTMALAWVHEQSIQPFLGSQSVLSQPGNVEQSEQVFKSSFGMDDEDTVYLRPRERMIDSGWIGDEYQLEWVKIQADTIQRKVVNLHKETFNGTDETELLIFDNTYVSVFIQPEEMMCSLNAELEKRSLTHSEFARISIVTMNRLLYDVENRQLILTKH
jgi:hypothetical protein